MPNYSLNGVSYASKTAVSDRAKAIKDAHKPGEYLKGDELLFMVDLLLWHPDAAGKIGAGVRSILIRANPKFNHNEFYLIRTDGSSTDFSYKQCIQPSTPEADFNTACRIAIAPDIISFEQAYFAANRISQCPLTGERLTSENSHVDHIPPETFAALLKSFIRSNNLRPGQVPLNGKHQDNNFRVEIADPQLRASWIAFHREQAQLRVISEQANLAIVGKEWDVILEYLCLIQHEDTLIDWKNKQRYFGHVPGLTRGVLRAAEFAPENITRFDGTIAILEMSLMTPERRLELERQQGAA